MDELPVTGTDVSRHDATPYDPLRHTLSVHDVELQLAAAGVPRTSRTIQRLCENATLNASPLGPNNQWLIAPDSVPKVIGDLRALDEQRARRVATLRDASRQETDRRSDIAPEASRHVATQHDMSQPEKLQIAPTSTSVVQHTGIDMSRHDATRHDMSSAAQRDNSGTTPIDVTRHVATEPDIFAHPYVKKLEDRVEKLEAKYEAQVRRTEEIQIRSQEKVLELQRMTTIGQSKQLAEFLLQAKEWLIPAASPLRAEN